MLNLNSPKDLIFYLYELKKSFEFWKSIQKYLFVILLILLLLHIYCETDYFLWLSIVAEVWPKSLLFTHIFLSNHIFQVI